ncbi:MAG: metallophosphoesterase [bacterium]
MKKLLSAILILVTAIAVNSGQKRTFNLDGEYGLWIENHNDSLTVHWITVLSDSGFLQVFQDGALIHEFATPLSQTHAVSFLRQGNRDITLKYGAKTSEAHRYKTRIDSETKPPKAVLGKVDSIYVLGDIHGEFDALTSLLRNAGLIDSGLDWTGGKRHLIALGDIFDRGHDVTRTLWFLYQLEGQAGRAGGRVHIVLGNHEIMTFVDDLRYLSGKERLIARSHKTHYANLYHPQNSLLGRWLASKPALLKIDKILFAHGGVHPLFSGYSVKAFNDSVRAYLNEDIFQYLLDDSLAYSKFDTLLYQRRLYFFFGDNSVFWYRGYVQTDTLKQELKFVLKKYKSKLHVIAHTPVPTISLLYDDKVIAVDLVRPVTEMLLLVRKGKKYKKYRCKLDGSSEPF